MDLEGKGKDNFNGRRDLEKRGIRKAKHPQKLSSDKFYLPPRCYSMDNGEQTMMCNLLKEVKVPDGYASNIFRCFNVKKRTISGLKSHDSHVLMKQLLPIAVSRTLPKKVSKPLIELCNFFRQLCSKVLKVDELDDLQSRIVLTLCELEKIFPPSFFDIMEHLPIHLVEEAKTAGPMQYPWMYYAERYLMTLKSYVRNRALPEGSIVEGYFVEECMTFYSRYLDDVESKLNRPVGNYDGGGEGQVGEIAMADAIERGRIPDPPPRWYPLGSIVSSSSEVATQMGVMARDGSLLPLHYNDWRYVPPHYKRRVWEEIKAHTTADDSMERWFMQSLGKKWQGWKSEAKKQGYKPYDNDTDRLAHSLDRVTEEKWRWFVYYWSHDKKKCRKDATDLNEETSAILDEIFIQAIGLERPGHKRGCGLEVTSTLQLAAKKQNQESSKPLVDLREFHKMKLKLGKIENAFETMGNIFEDSDDDLHESFLKEKAPDASSVHRQMTTDSHRDNKQERHPESREAGLLSQLNSRPNSQGEGSPTNPNSQAKSGPSETGKNQQTTKEADVQALAKLTRALNKKGCPTNPSSQAKSGPSETGNMQQIAKEARVQALAELTHAFNQKVSIVKMHFATRKILGSMFWTVFLGL
ncbi:hypothetical protein Vadar_025651 [Vaccinium darrowii]|uniref:Uncharacterized protein n=1 Tax=Vaccinium darrowii TaxID=229202 RepID=A0ACB7YI52_9ERIC|nr:hypothetical protein Vadar_025651 [Vaccinium darrowii]